HRALACRRLPEVCPQARAVEPITSHERSQVGDCPAIGVTDLARHAECRLAGKEPVVTKTIEPMPAQIDQQLLARELVERACAEGVDLVGPDGLLAGLTKTVLE